MLRYQNRKPLSHHTLDVVASLCCLFITQKSLHADSLQVDYFTPKNVYTFANYLFREGDYLRAAAEFQRYLFGLGSTSNGADSVLHKIGLCYRLGKDFTMAVNYFQKVIDNYRQGAYVSNSYYQIAYSYFLMGKHRESISYSDSILPFIAWDNNRLKIQQLIGLNYIYQKQWIRGADFLYSLDETAKNDSLVILLMEFAEKGQYLQRKNELLAGLFSAVIPGAGKAYCGRSSDGLFSLIVIGLMGWQAYENFRNDGIYSVKGWIYGTMSGVFYLGNIYGSVVAAKIYNEEQENKLLDKVGLSVNVYLP